MKKVFKTLFLLIIVLFSLGQLQRIQLTEVISIYAHEIVISIWLVLVVIKNTQETIKLAKKLTQNKLLLIIFIWIMLGLFINFLISGFSLIPILYLSRVISYALFGISLSIVKPFSIKQQQHYWFVGGLLVVFWGFLQYFLLPDTRFLRYLGWDDHYLRLISTQLDPNFTGILLGVSFFLLQGIKLRPDWTRKVLSLIIAIAILLTYSRASYLSFILSSVLLFILYIRKFHKTRLYLLVIIGFFILSLPFLPRAAGEGVKLERTFSINSRIDSNVQAFEKIDHYQWIIGQGLFTPLGRDQKLPWMNTAHFPDNLLVFIISSTGIIGLGLFTMILYKSLVFLYTNDIFILSAFVAILIHSQFNHTLFQPFVWLWISSLVLTQLEFNT
jgi:hypothetical protein